MRELEKVKMIVFEATGLDLGYAYDDLVFSEHGIFILQFDEISPRNLNCYFNHECYEEDKVTMFEKLAEVAGNSGFVIIYTGLFRMEQMAGKEEIKINFEVA